MEALDSVIRSRPQEMTAPTGKGRRSARVARFVAAVLTIVGLAQPIAAQSLAAPQLKGAYLFNFIQFIEWPADAVPSGDSLTLCIVNDEPVANAVDNTIKGRTVDGHSLDVRRLKVGERLPTCHLLYLGGANLKESLAAVEAIKGVFVLTVSDATRFADTGGMVELFVEGGRMKFAVNTDAMQRARIRLSSRVLGLAKIVRDPKTP